MKKKIKIYEDVSKFIEALDQLGLPLKEISKSIEHEEEHLAKLR